MRKRPEIPEDVFFDTAPAREKPETESEPPAEPEAAAQPGGNGQDGDVLAKSMDSDRAPQGERRHVRLSEARAERARRRSEQQRENEQQSEPRVGRPPAQEGPKVAVTLYLTEPVAHLLEEVKFLLLTEYDVKTTKSAIADFALRNGLDDLQAAADDLRRE